MRQAAILERLGTKTETLEEENITPEEHIDTQGYAQLKRMNYTVQRDESTYEHRTNVYCD